MRCALTIGGMAVLLSLGVLYGEEGKTEPEIHECPLESEREVPVHYCEISYPIVLEPSERTSFTIRQELRVRHVHKHMGESFQKGDLLIEFEDAVPQAFCKKAQAFRERAEALYESKQRLYEKNMIAHSELLEAKADWLASCAELTIAEENLKEATVYAPYDGRVVAVAVHEGEYPGHEFYLKNKPMLEIVSDQSMLAKVLVPSSEMGHLQCGQDLVITLKETGEEISAVLERIGVLIDPTSATIPVEARVDNQDGHLMGGMMGKGKVVMRAPKEDKVAEDVL